MDRVRIAELPLHYGHTPRWLFERMKTLSAQILKIIVDDFGTDEVLKRFSNPFWFQAFSCVIGFDWHSSGTTTVTLGALKASIDPQEYGVAIVGGKGLESLKTCDEIGNIAEIFSLSSEKCEKLRYISRIAAKIDNACIQDGYRLYHHSMIIDKNGNWTIVQQGMNVEKKYARRYHWSYLSLIDPVVEPHSGIISSKVHDTVLNMVAKESEECRKTCVDIVKDNPMKLRQYVVYKPRKESLDKFLGIECLRMPWKIDWEVLRKVYEFQPRNYEELIGIKGVGPSTVRALAYISDVIYGTEPSWRDPAKYTFAVGGKDGVPKPIDRKTYDECINILQYVIEKCNLERKEKREILGKLNSLIPSQK